MREIAHDGVATAEIPSPRAFASSAGERLTAATAVLAGRLADLLERALPGTDERVSGREFLRAMAGEAEDPLADFRLPDGLHPLDRLGAGFDLSPVELDLIVLAGLAEEHEGYSGILRTLHPR